MLSFLLDKFQILRWMLLVLKMKVGIWVYGILLHSLGTHEISWHQLLPKEITLLFASSCVCSSWTLHTVMAVAHAVCRSLSLFISVNIQSLSTTRWALSLLSFLWFCYLLLYISLIVTCHIHPEKAKSLFSCLSCQSANITKLHKKQQPFPWLQYT